MSYEFKMQGRHRGKRSRLYKKTKRTSMNRIDAPHLPMRVQSDKNGYWGQTSRAWVVHSLEIIIIIGTFGFGLTMFFERN